MLNVRFLLRGASDSISIDSSYRFINWVGGDEPRLGIVGGEKQMSEATNIYAVLAEEANLRLDQARNNGSAEINLGDIQRGRAKPDSRIFRNSFA